MSHLTIYVKRSKGKLQYRDSEGNTGDTITSHAKHDEKIIWKLDKCSGISEITGIQLKGDLSILNGTPRKVDFNQWEVYTSGKAEGELTYAIEFEKCKGMKDEEVESQGLRDSRPPTLRIP